MDILERSGNEPVLVERSDFYVRLANSEGQRSKCSVLINRMYAWRGYKSSTQNIPAHADQVTLQACTRENVIGTLTLCFDSARGLAADALYRREIDVYRSAGAKVCELTRLAVDPKEGSKHLLGALFHLAYIHGSLLRRPTDVFIEVNPRHVSFYQRMLHFRQAGECRTCARVNAPAVLLHLTVAYVAEQIARYAGRRERDKSSLYSYFFSEKEARGLPRRILRQQAQAVRPTLYATPEAAFKGGQTPPSSSGFCVRTTSE